MEKQFHIHSLNKERTSTNKHIVVSYFIIMIFLGILSGVFLVKKLTPESVGSQIQTSEGLPINLQEKKIYGSDDVSLFKDSAEGVLEAGGIDSEGTHKLIRPGGESQTVYLTSSVIDLNKFVNKKVRIWGETFAAQKAGWLMDVGRLEAL